MPGAVIAWRSIRRNLERSDGSDRLLSSRFSPLSFNLFNLSHVFFICAFFSRKSEFRIIRRERRNFGKYEKFKRFDDVGIVLDRNFCYFYIEYVFYSFQTLRRFLKRSFFSEYSNTFVISNCKIISFNLIVFHINKFKFIMNCYFKFHLIDRFLFK